MLRLYTIHLINKQSTEVKADRYTTMVLFQPEGHYFYNGKDLIAYFPTDRVEYIVSKPVGGIGPSETK